MANLDGQFAEATAGCVARRGEAAIRPQLSRSSDPSPNSDGAFWPASEAIPFAVGYWAAIEVKLWILNVHPSAVVLNAPKTNRSATARG
jgi:hypothetical protein